MGDVLPEVTPAAQATLSAQQPTGVTAQQLTGVTAQQLTGDTAQQPAAVAGQPPGEGGEMVPIEHEGSERMVRVMIFAVPPALLALAGWLAWGGTLHWQDLVVLAITYTLTGLGITVGYHRLVTHRFFQTA